MSSATLSDTSKHEPVGWTTAGFELLPTFAAPHYDLLLPGGQYPDAARVRAVFSSPEPNPFKRRGRSR